MVQKEPCTSRGFGSRKLVKVTSIAKEKPGAECSAYMGDAHMPMLRHTCTCTHARALHARMLKYADMHRCMHAMHTDWMGSNIL